MYYIKINDNFVSIEQSGIVLVETPQLEYAKKYATLEETKLTFENNKDAVLVTIIKL